MFRRGWAEVPLLLGVADIAVVLPEMTAVHLLLLCPVPEDGRYFHRPKEGLI